MTEPGGAKLEILNGEQAGEVCDLTADGPNPIGTSRQARVRLKAKGVHFKHAVLLPQENGFVLVQERSAPETLVNGERLEPKRGRLLQDGDTLRVGPVELKFTAEARPAPSPVAPPAQPAPRPAPVAAAPPQEELIRLQTANRSLADELGALVAARHHGELGHVLAELTSARAERDAAVRRRVKLEERLRALIVRMEDETQVKNKWIIAEANKLGESHPMLSAIAERDAQEQRWRDVRRELDAHLVEAEAAEARHLEALGDLRTQLAEARAQADASAAHLDQLNAELVDQTKRSDLAEAALSALRAKLGDA